LCGNPLQWATGKKIQTETDYVSPLAGGLRFVRTYSSSGYYRPLSVNDIDPLPLGEVWTHNYQSRVYPLSGGNVNVMAVALRPDGSFKYFATNGWEYLNTGESDHLSATTGGWTYTGADSVIETYGTDGKLLAVNDHGRIVTNSYSDASTPGSIAPGPGYLIQVSDAFGHALNLRYDANGHLVAMKDPSGIEATYQYEGPSATTLSSPPGTRLTMVTQADTTTRTYFYNEQTYTGSSDFPRALTGLVDENGVRFATWRYQGNGFAYQSQHPNGVELTNVFRASTGTAFSVQNAAGFTDGYTVTLTGGVARATTVNYPCSLPTCPDQETFNYDPVSGDLLSRVDRNGVTTSYETDPTRHVETSRTEAVGTPRARTIGTQWQPTLDVPTQVDELGRRTTFTYDGYGNPLTKTVTDTAAGTSRTWTYTYDSYGRMLTAVGPRTDVVDKTTYTYYTCTSGYQCGMLNTITDALGHVTTYNTYSAHGQPLTITDPNNVVTTMTYDARQRLSSRQMGTETTSFAYYSTGLLKKVTLPDSSVIQYTYDDAHRLTNITDNLGNHIDYTLDLLSNRTAESAYDPAGVLHRTRSRKFDLHNRIGSEIGAAGTANVTTVFGYDNVGNQTSIAAPLSRTTTNAYDELNRVKQITDPANGITQFGYDANDNLTTVTDPRSLTTSYSYNGFGDLTNQVSPDTGTTTNTYDSAGNLATSTDARGAVSTYTYDALNRVTSAAYSQGGTTDQTISFTYDAGTNGKGHLTGASDANHSMAWTYDALGRVTSKTQTVGAVTRSVGYAYTNGNLTTLTTPSGQVVSYGYNSDHQVASVTVNGTTTLNSVTYEPLGPVTGWTWGNGTTTMRTYDTDGKISQIVSAGTKTYGYDDAFRITGISDTSTGSANWTYGYDALDRITSGTSASVIRGWSYDANGNRLTETGTAASTYSISSTNNRITGITGALARSYGYDAAGNTTSYATVAATYNNAGRLQTLTQGGSTETTLYNAFGQRIQKSGGTAGTVLFWYDEAGHLLGEYDGSGSLIEETVWLGDIPVATLRPNGSSASIYYVHTDQLNTPRQITRPRWSREVAR